MAHEEQDYVDGWKTYSEWLEDFKDQQPYLDEYARRTGLELKLANSSSDVEGFSLIWHHPLLRVEIEQKYKEDLRLVQRKRLKRSIKSVEESKRLRELGNKSFKDGDFMRALKNYTDAVRVAPYPVSQSSSQTQDDCLALALANRSAALYALTRYRLCLLDIDLAIKIGYPKNNLFKLLIRKVKCLHILSVWTNDVEQMKETLKQMLKNKDTKEYIKTEISNMFEFIEQTQPENLEKDELDIVDETTMKISNLSKTLTQAADCVEMSYDTEKGRYLMTNKDISYGRLLVAEEPFVSNLAPSKRDSYCYHCLANLHHCGIGCSKCTQVLFCSEECLNAMSDIHGFECNKFLDFQDILGVAYLVSHIMFKVNFDLSSIPVYTKKTVTKKPLLEALEIPTSDWPDLVYKSDYTSMLSLMDHAEDYDYDQMFGFLITATYLLIAFCDNYSTSLPILKDEQTQLVVGSIILKHLMQLQTNLISILDQNLQGLTMVGHTLSEVKERPIGVGFYPTISLLNHSCKPNILSFFHKSKFIARAATSLECGTEINYCYGPSVNRMSKKDRQRRLKEQYFFTCSCQSCSSNEESESRALLCSKCQGPVIYNEDLSHECKKCGQNDVVDVRLSLKQIDSYRKLLSELEESEKEPNKKLEELRTLETNLSKIAFWRNPLFAQIKSQLVDCASSLDDCSLGLEYCLEELSLCENTYGENSYESIVTKLKLINLRWQVLYYAIEESKTAEEKGNNMKELRLLVLTINETRGKLKDLLTSTNITGAESSFQAELKFLSSTQTLINNYIANEDSHANNTSETSADS